MSKVVVTGGAGFIGSHLTDALIKQGDQVIVIDNLSTGKKDNLNPKAEFFQLDICDFEKIRPVFTDCDFVFHLAAIPRMPLSIERPRETSQINIMGTISVFKAASEAKADRVVFASSSSVYGPQNTLPLKEEMIPNPISPYGLQKWVGERFAEMFGKHYDLSVVCLRYFNVYGPRVDFESDYSLVVGKFLRQHEQGEPLTIYGDGEQTRGFCYVGDVVRATIKAAKAEGLRSGEIINIGLEKSHSVNYLAQLIGGEKRYLPERPGDPKHTQADMSKAKELLNWQPLVSFEQGVERTWQWYKGTLNTER